MKSFDAFIHNGDTWIWLVKLTFLLIRYLISLMFYLLFRLFKYIMLNVIWNLCWTTFTTTKTCSQIYFHLLPNWFIPIFIIFVLIRATAVLIDKQTSFYSCHETSWLLFFILDDFLFEISHQHGRNLWSFRSLFDNFSLLAHDCHS